MEQQSGIAKEIEQQNIKIHPLTLHFHDELKDLESDYQTYHHEKSLIFQRIVILISILFYAFFGLLDAFLIPEKKYIFWFIRYAVVCPFAFAVILFSFSKKYKKYKNIALFSMFIIGGFGIDIMILLATPPASYSYYTGLLLILIFLFTFSHLQFVWAFFASWLMIAFYEIIAIGLIATPVAVLVNNNFFIIGGNLFCILAGYSIERSSRKNFYLASMLDKEKQIVLDKNEELKKRVQSQSKAEGELRKKNLEIEKIILERTKQLQKSEELFKLITENTSALVSIHDSDANYIFASPSHNRLGYKPEELIGQSGFTMMQEKDIGTLLEKLEQAKTGDLSKAILNYTLQDKNGNRHEFRGAFDAIFQSDGSLERIVCVSEDITELKQANQQREEALSIAAEAKKMALVGQVAGKMAHDFNNILSIIMGNAEMSLLDCTDTIARQTLELIFDQTIRGKNLTNNLVAFAKDQEPKQEYFPINQKIELVLSLLKKDLEGIDVICEYGNRIPDILADPGMTEHALVNILQNAIHAISLTETPEIIIKTFHENDNIFIEIKDNGCGIPQEYIEKIYDPSFTLKGGRDKDRSYKKGIKGTGYGLANTKKYIERHNGTFSIESVFQNHTIATIILPVIKMELTKNEKLNISREKKYSDKHILLVEDEQAISNVQYRILTSDPCCHKVDIADKGQDAIELFNRNAYNFVSLDYILSDSINGMDVYRHIRNKNKTIPILFVSGNIEFLESITELMKKDAYVSHVSKPCKNIDYINNINKLIGQISN